VEVPFGGSSSMIVCEWVCVVCTRECILSNYVLQGSFCGSNICHWIVSTAVGLLGLLRLPHFPYPHIPRCTTFIPPFIRNVWSGPPMSHFWEEGIHAVAHKIRFFKKKYSRQPYGIAGVKKIVMEIFCRTNPTKFFQYSCKIFSPFYNDFQKF